jgi:hypothetical protein
MANALLVVDAVKSEVINIKEEKCVKIVLLQKGISSTGRTAMRKKLNAFFRRSKEHGLKVGQRSKKHGLEEEQRSKKHAIDSLDCRRVHIKKF